MKLNQTEQFIVWGITGNLTDESTVKAIESSIEAFKEAGILTDKGERLFNEVLEHEKASGLSILHLLDDDAEYTHTYQVYDMIDDNLLGVQVYAELSLHEIATVVLLMAKLNHFKTLRALRETIEGVGGTQYSANLAALYDEVRENEYSTHRSLYAKLEHVLEEMGYIDKNQ